MYVHVSHISTHVFLYGSFVFIGGFLDSREARMGGPNDWRLADKTTCEMRERKKTQCE